ncbi:YvrJ family protein [Paenibacillus terrae]|nr:YvrJ family protein [Paenibacillus terrae]
MDDALSIITNVGFPAGLCFILLRHILHTMEEKLDKLDLSLHELIEVIKELNDGNRHSSKGSKLDE